MYVCVVTRFDINCILYLYPFPIYAILYANTIVQLISVPHHQISD